MSKTIFFAGASGVIGRRLTPLLREAGYVVHGLTRSVEKARELEDAGVHGIVGDVYDGAALRALMNAVAPDIVVHQLTDLPDAVAGGLSADDLAKNARIRIEGTRNLVDAARACGARHIAAQSLIWIYAPGPEPHTETDALDTQTRASVITLEELVTQSPPLRGCALRFGQFYGPGTWHEAADGRAPLHIDAAAYATLLAIQHAATGTFNVAEDAGYADSSRAKTELGWNAALRHLEPLDGPPPDVRDRGGPSTSSG